jgi:RimJ/RimL family protein N-acetyltransferase
VVRPVADRDPIHTARLDLVLLTLDTLDGLLAGRRSVGDGVALPPDWLSRFERLARRRRDQIAEDPEHERWVLRVMVLRDTRAVVGNIGFHGKPGSNALGAIDAVELGYSVEEAFRRQGFAEEAIRGMIGWARSRSISRFLVSVSPTNAPSLALAAKLGFSEVTRVIDDEDGPEIVFELRT